MPDDWLYEAMKAALVALDSYQKRDTLTEDKYRKIEEVRKEIALIVWEMQDKQERVM